MARQVSFLRLYSGGIQNGSASKSIVFLFCIGVAKTLCLPLWENGYSTVKCNARP